MLTLELLFSLGLATIAFASFIGYFHSVRQQQAGLQRFVAGTFLLQSTLEQVRSGRYGSLETLDWTQSGNDPASRWETPSRTQGPFTWRLTSETRPRHGEIFPVQIVVTWKERNRLRSISAAMEIMTK